LTSIFGAGGSGFISAGGGRTLANAGAYIFSISGLTSIFGAGGSGFISAGGGGGGTLDNDGA
jgi:hypothetical protein